MVVVEVAGGEHVYVGTISGPRYVLGAGSVGGRTEGKFSEGPEVDCPGDDKEVDGQKEACNEPGAGFGVARQMCIVIVRSNVLGVRGWHVVRERFLLCDVGNPDREV